jgi:hypothetical protein
MSSYDCEMSGRTVSKGSLVVAFVLAACSHIAEAEGRQLYARARCEVWVAVRYVSTASLFSIRM